MLPLFKNFARILLGRLATRPHCGMEVVQNMVSCSAGTSPEPLEGTANRGGLA
jgi:hypothetical protein